MNARLLLLLLLCAPAAHAQANGGDIGIDEHLGATIPQSLVFSTPEDEPTTLSDHVGRDLPVLLVFAYTRCRALCSVVLESSTRLMNELEDLRPGRDYRPLLVGLDPKQALDEARRHQALLRKRVQLGEDDAVAYPYLIGREAQIAALADAVGFRYAWDARSEQYAHPAVLIVIDRAGRVARYLHALGTEPDELADALRAAARPDAEPVVHASLAGDLLRCFRFDPALRRHRAAIELYFRIGGALIFVLLAGLVLGLLWRERRRAR